jgi:hypothetical protein
MEDNSNQTKNGESVNFWTSYSDLLLGLSIIFLVLFFFATVRSGVQQQAVVKRTEDYMSGKVSLEENQQSKIRQEKLKRELIEIETKKAALLGQSRELALMASDINHHQGLVQELIQDVNVRNDSLERSVKNVTELKSILKSKDLEINHLEQTLTASEERTKSVGEHHLAKLAELQENHLRESNELKRKLALALNRSFLADDRVKEVEASMEKQVGQLKTSIQDLTQNLQSEKQEKNNLEKNIAMLMDEKVKENERIRGSLKASNAALEMEKGESQRLRSQLGQLMSQLNQTKKNYENQLVSRDGEMFSNFITLHGNKQECDILAQKNKTLVGQIKHLQEDQDSELSRLRVDCNRLKADASQRELSAENAKKYQARELASKHGIAPKPSLHPVKEEIETVLAAHSVNTLEIDEYKLNGHAKGTLSKFLIDIFNKVNKDPQVDKSRVRVFITGHSSPKYFGRYVPEGDPAYQKSLNYNQELSEKRAQETSKFIFSNEIQSFPGKDKLESVTRVDGKGFTEPVMSDPKSGSKGECGAVDCDLSQRVEVKVVIVRKEEKK